LFADAGDKFLQKRIQGNNRGVPSPRQTCDRKEILRRVLQNCHKLIETLTAFSKNCGLICFPHEQPNTKEIAYRGMALSKRKIST